MGYIKVRLGTFLSALLYIISCYTYTSQHIFIYHVVDRVQKLRIIKELGKTELVVSVITYVFPCLNGKLDSLTVL